MLKLVTLVCVVGVAGLLIVGGCTPEANKTWSESVDFSEQDEFLQDMSGTYDVLNNLDERFTTISLYQTGASLQGFDNMRRSWNGTISGGGQVNLQTNDGPGGQAIMVGNTLFFVYPGETQKHKGIDAVFYFGDRSGWIQCIGPYEAD